MDDQRGRSTRADSGERTRRRRPRDPKVDEAILIAAVDLLGEIGYARLTMDQVVTRAGVGKASLYLRWPNKVALVAEAIQHRSGAVPEVPDTGSLREDMLMFLRTLLRTQSGARRALFAVSGEIASHPELREAFHRSVAATLLACVRAIVERAVDRGELPPSSDVDLLALLPQAYLQQWHLVYEGRPDDEFVARIVEQFFTPATSHVPADPTVRAERLDQRRK